MGPAESKEFHECINDCVSKYKLWKKAREETYEILHKIRNKVHYFERGMDGVNISGIVIDIFTGAIGLSSVMLGPQMVLGSAVIKLDDIGMDVTSHFGKLGFDNVEAKKIQEALDRDTEATTKLIQLIKDKHVKYPDLPGTNALLRKDCIDAHGKMVVFVKGLGSIIMSVEGAAAQAAGEAMPALQAFSLSYDVSKLVHAAIESDKDKKGVLEKRIDKIIELLEINAKIIEKALE